MDRGIEGSGGRLQVWGGAECTINRIGGCFHNQLARRSLPERLADLERIASLGVTALRFPVLWEEVSPENGGSFNWAWADAGLGRLRQLGIRPIVGLLHHGSGPRYTNLLDPLFAEKLSEFARQVAERFPWVEDYTPVNEPLTTARFSALYGHWYPHLRSAQSFCRALLNQVRGTAFAVAAIREVNSAARLIQTDDLGITLSSSKLAYQAAFENERRWATFDLLTGRLEQAGRMWGYLREAGVSESVLAKFLANPCPPEVIGINHYITSARYLEEDPAAHPEVRRGGNGRHAYADVEAVRSEKSAFYEPSKILRQAWERYGIPLAITEAHLGCTREEQMRWFAELWEGAQGLREEGIPLVAVTAWSMLGAYDWDSLLVRDRGHPAPGRRRR